MNAPALTPADVARGKVAAMGKDTTTRYQGVFARHRKGCAVERGRDCDCRPSFYGVAYDRAEGRSRKTKRAGTATAARDLRADLLRAIDRGDVVQRSDIRVGEAVERFLEAAGAGRALNKHGRRYKPRAVEDMADALRLHAVPALGRQRRLSDVRGGHVQEMVDDLSHLSGSRVRSVVNAVRSLYRWARRRDLVFHDPAQDVELPAMDATPRERVATPPEFRRLLETLTLEDALPYAIAGYATARRAEILSLRWQDIDLDVLAGTLGADPEARKYDASLRVVPILAPLAAMLRRAYLAQGRPGQDMLVCPPQRNAKTGRLSPDALAKRAMRAWGWVLVERDGDQPQHWRPGEDALVPVTLHDARHSAASWMSAAGVPPAVVSKLMGHSLRLPGGAAVTERYTHALPDDVERARELLDAFIVEREQREAAER